MYIMQNHVHKLPEQDTSKRPATRAEYLREWRKKNPEKNSQYCRNYWKRREAEARQQQEKVKP